MRHDDNYPPVKQVLPFGSILLIIAIAYTAALWVESWLAHSATGISYGMVSVGVLVGGLTRVRSEQWLTVIGVVVAIKLLWLVLIAGEREIASIAFSAGSQLALTLFIASAPKLLLPEHKRDYLSHEIFTALNIGTVVGAFAYAMLIYFERDAPGSSLMVASAFCSVVLGTAVAGAPMTVWGMVYGRPANYSWKRNFFLAISIPGFLLFTFASLTGEPTALVTLFTPYSYVHVWLALIFGLSVASNASTTLLVSLMMSVVFASAIVFCQQPRAADINAVLQWQTTAIGIHVVTMIAGVLVAGLRRFSQLAFQRLRIARAMVKASAKAESADAGRPKVDLVDALEIAGHHCRADECRLYRFDDDQVQALCINIWVRQADVVDTAQLAEPFAISELAPMLAKLENELPFFYEDNEPAQLPVNGFRQALRLPKGSEIAFYPICLGERLLGMIGIIGYSLDQLRKRNAPMLLSGIGYYYIGIHTQNEAARSIRRYEDRMSELAARFAEAEERVRRETSREIHDGLIQQLAVMRMKLGELGQRRISAPETLSTITSIVDETLIESRSMLQRLSPSVLYELGLMPALQNLCDIVNEEGIFDVTLRESGSRVRLDEPVRVAFYHVIKELIENSQVHSQGSNIWIDINWNSDGIEQASVSDDGKAEVWWLLRKSGSKHGELGLLAASERLHRFDYLLTFLPREGGGTSAIIRPAMIFSVPERPFSDNLF